MHADRFTVPVPVELDAEAIEFLSAAVRSSEGRTELERAAAALRMLASLTVRGMRNPNAWERSLVNAAFGHSFEQRLEPVPEQPARMRVRK